MLTKCLTADNNCANMIFASLSFIFPSDNSLECRPPPDMYSITKCSFVGVSNTSYNLRNQRIPFMKFILIERNNKVEFGRIFLI